MNARALACGVLIVLLAGACSDQQDSVPRVEKDALITQADAVCKTANADVQTLLNGPGGTTGVDEGAARDLLNTKVLPRLDRELGDLKDLGEPKSDRSAWDEIVKQYDGALTALKQEADVDAVKAVGDVSDKFAFAYQKARDFGLKECG
jgi:hypothetical protein